MARLTTSSKVSVLRALSNKIFSSSENGTGSTEPFLEYMFILSINLKVFNGLSLVPKKPRSLNSP